ncbi:MAG: hypothetical protein K9L70_12390 [Thiohalocapsa sp.]|nr:hypothetical protein [Thiohalocapsa sp.]
MSADLAELLDLYEAAEAAGDTESVDFLGGLIARADAAPVEPTAFGAPPMVRAAVGAADLPRDRLSTLQGFYPDARPYGDDNFAYTDPTGQTRLYNPKGLDRGDFASILPEAGEFIGGTLGALAGTAGGIPGAMAGAGIGAAGGGAAVEQLMARFGPTVDTSTRQERLTDAAMTAALGAAGEGAGRLAMQGLSSGARSLVARPGVAERLDLFRRTGVDPTGAPGEIAGAKWFQGATANIDRIPGGARMQEARERTMATLQGRIEGLAAGVSPSGEVPLRGAQGGVLREGAEAAGEGWRARQGELYGRMLQATEGVTLTPGDLPAVGRLRDELAQAIADNPGMSGHLVPAQQELDRLLQFDRVGYGQAREYMTHLGQKLEDPAMATGYVGKSGQALRRVYGALREDLDSAVSRQASDAAAAVRAHDDHVRGFNAPGPTGLSDEQLLKRMLSGNADDLVNYVRQGSTRGAGRLEQVRDVLAKNGGQAQWDAFRGGLLRDMGWSAKDEAWSATRFAGAWNELTPQARAVLFPDIGGDVGDLARVSELLKEVESLVNRSNTGAATMTNDMIRLGVGGAGSALGGSVGGLAGAAAFPVVGSVANRALASPSFARGAVDGAIGAGTGVASGAAGRAGLTAMEPPMLSDSGAPQAGPMPPLLDEPTREGRTPLMSEADRLRAIAELERELQRLRGR